MSVEKNFFDWDMKMRRFKHIEEQKSRKDTYQSPLLADWEKNPIIVNIKHPRLQKTKLQKKKKKKKKTTTTTPP